MGLPGSFTAFFSLLLNGTDFKHFLISGFAGAMGVRSMKTPLNSNVSAIERIVQAGHGHSEIEIQELRVQEVEQVCIFAGNDEALIVCQMTFVR